MKIKQQVILNISEFRKIKPLIFYFFSEIFQYDLNV